MQIWDTWNELDGQHDVREAFLLVFRRKGRLVTFDEFALYNGRTLFPILVDIAPPQVKGARATMKPIHIAAADLLPDKKVKASTKLTFAATKPKSGAKGAKAKATNTKGTKSRRIAKKKASKKRGAKRP